MGLRWSKLSGCLHAKRGLYQLEARELVEAVLLERSKRNKTRENVTTLLVFIGTLQMLLLKAIYNTNNTLRKNWLKKGKHNRPITLQLNYQYFFQIARPSLTSHDVTHLQQRGW